MDRTYMKSFVIVVTLFVAIVSGASSYAESGTKGGAMSVSEGKEVSLEYTLRLENKEVVDSNVGKQPLTFTHGSQQIIPGLERELEGLVEGDTKVVTVAPEDGYGKVDPKAFQEVEKEKIPADAQKVGAQLQGKDASGRVFRTTIKEIKEKTIVLDFNHPLAGKILVFDVKVLGVKDKPKDAAKTPKE